MVTATPRLNHLKNSKKKPRNVYYIGGIQVEFPYQPYGTQLAFMSRVVSTLDRANRDGHCHALLESPTGTGKSLSLLCSVLAWQKKYKLTNQNGGLSHSKAAPEAITDPLAHGGGFIPETQPLGDPEPAQAESNKRQKSKRIPTIYYASRTHSQLSQVIREYRKTTYRVPMAVLASRKHYCINPNVHGKDNVDEECKLLLKDKGNIQCYEFKNVQKVVSHPSLQSGGCHDVHDIEDLVKVGQIVRGCPYHAARNMSDHAQLVFCPYNYIINPVIRGAMEVDVKGAIVILDEAHNIEDVARQAGSIDIEEDTLFRLQTELEQLTLVNAIIYQPLCEMIQGLISWIERKKGVLEKREFQHYFSCWTGDKAIRELQESNISQQCFPILLDCATKAIKLASDSETVAPHLSGMGLTVLEGLFASLTYLFSRNGSHILDYQLGLQKAVKRDSRSWSCTFSLWCLNPAVVFRDIADLSLSIILTSGTLSPMGSFSTELGVHFDTCLEAPHVIDVSSQVWAAAISSGPGKYPLNAGYKTADAYMFQDALGKALERICSVVPGGTLVFFPSYKLMEKLCFRWRETGQWSRLNLVKSLYVEPRGNQEEFEPVLKGYYNAISSGRKPTIGRKRVTKIINIESSGALKDNKKRGAAFLAVCRGKVSEGIDFSDEYARVVIVVGIPFPNINDIQVGLKKKYNDIYRSSKNLLSGSEWYCQQAFRALNQAAGRCVRHRFDYGAIILLDERFREERNKIYISKWLRQSIKQYEDFEVAITGLESFFRDAKEHVEKARACSHECETVEVIPTIMNNSKNVPSQICQKPNDIRQKTNSKFVMGVQNPMVVEPDIPPVNRTRGHLKRREQKSGHSQDTEQSYVSVTKSGQYQVRMHAQVPMSSEGLKECEDGIDQEFSSPAKSGCWDMPMTFSYEDRELVIVKETSTPRQCASTSSSSVSKNGSSSLTAVQVSETPDKSCSHMQSADPRKGSKAELSLIVTPETGDSSKFIPKIEASSSVTSYVHKRRKSSCSTFIDLVDDDMIDVNGTQCMNLTRRIEFDSERTCIMARPRVSLSSCPAVGELLHLQIFCDLCGSPLGLPRSHHYVECLVSSSSKSHLISLLKETAGPFKTDDPPSVSILIADSSSVNQRLYKSREGALGQGVWCEQDGCVFNNVNCPFCSCPTNCLGVHVMATDSSNSQLLDKMLFYMNRLAILNPTDEEDGLEMIDQLSGRDQTVRSEAVKVIDSGGWRTTRSKLRLPRSKDADGQQ